MIAIKLPQKQNSFSQQRNKTMLKVGIAVFLKNTESAFCQGWTFQSGHDLTTVWKNQPQQPWNMGRSASSLCREHLCEINIFSTWCPECSVRGRVENFHHDWTSGSGNGKFISNSKMQCFQISENGEELPMSSGPKAKLWMFLVWNQHNKNKLWEWVFHAYNWPSSLYFGGKC